MATMIVNIMWFELKRGDSDEISKKLREGAIIGLAAPSSPVSSERVMQCRAVLEAMGFKVIMADNLAVSKGGYMAGDEECRADWINKMFADKEVEAIFCIRGGDGGNRILDYIDLETIRENKKIFCRLQ